jgi:hypothetical protein
MPVRLFNLDLHISVIEDIRYIFNLLYGDNVEITNWSISSHNWVFNKKTANVIGINKESWLNINESMIELFHATYDDYLCTFDGFIVTHTPVFSMLFEKYKKPILCINSCRFDQPFCAIKSPMEQVFLTALERMVQSKQLTIVSNNKADAMYLYNATKIVSHIIPSLCLYTEAPHTPFNMGFIIYGEKRIFPNHTLLIERPTNYSWKDLHSYQGIIHVPYEMSTMSIFEQFWSGVPLFFPRKEFYKKCLLNDTMSFISIYSNDKKTLSEEDIDRWFNQADFYTLPYINYYDSFEDLIEKIENFEDIEYKCRIEWISNQKSSILGMWSQILEKVF